METKKSEKKVKWWQSITIKFVIVVLLSIILLIPSFMVKKLINEREDRKESTITEIAEKWGFAFENE